MTRKEFLAQTSPGLRKWFLLRPKRVQAAVLKTPPLWCYRQKDKRGHYVLIAYDEDSKGKITVKVQHLADSFLPGFGVFGVNPETLVKCGCAKS